MNDSTDAACATDVERCLYLARGTERLGHHEAAGRWYEKAERWLETIAPRGQESRMRAEDSNGSPTPKAFYTIAPGRASAPGAMEYNRFAVEIATKSGESEARAARYHS